VPRIARPATGADVAATLAILTVLGGAVGGRALLRRFSERPSPEECTALLDRYVELCVRAAMPQPVPSILADRRAAARTLAGERGFVRCEADLTRTEVACALQAGSADDLERCLP
jgi:hypothetical protein